MEALGLTFLGTGNFLAPPGRYWNSFVAEGDLTVLVEPSPTALPNLRRAGYSVEQLDAIVISHFHPDHTFGWPFLLLEIVWHKRDPGRPLQVIGPPGVERFLEDMMRLGSVIDIQEASRALDIHYVEASTSGERQEAGSLGFRAVEVDHVPELACFGYILEIGGRRLAYSGDTRPCPGLEALAAGSDTLVLECNGVHAAESHMDVASVLSLRERFPELTMIATHLGPEVTAPMLPGITILDDFERIDLP